MAAISSNRTGIRKAFRRLFKGKEDTPVKQDFGISNPETPEEMKKFQEEQDYRRERRQGNKPVNVRKKPLPSVIPAEESPKLKSQKQTSEKEPQRLVSNQGVPLKFIEEVKEAKRKEAFKPIDEQIKGSVKRKEVKVKSGQDVISDDMSFGKAFRAARNEGMKTFTWRGKKYGTSLKKKEKSKTTTQAATQPSTGNSNTPPQSNSSVSQKEKINEAISKIDKSISQMQNNPSGFFGLLSEDQKNQRIKLRKRKEMLQLRKRKEMLKKKLKNLSQ